MANAVSASLGAVGAESAADLDGSTNSMGGTGFTSIATSVATGGAALSAAVVISGDNGSASTAAGAILAEDVALYVDLTAEGAVDGTSAVIFAITPPE